MALLLRIVTALVGAGACWLVAFLSASRLLQGLNIWVRVVGGLVLGYWFAAWGFEILGLLGWFELRVIVPLLVLLPAAILVYHRATVASQLRQSWVEMRDEAQQLVQELRAHRWVTAGLCLIGFHLVARMVRALATPAFGWDDFTYHLFRAGRWVQNGGLALEPAPDAWTYYEFFPWGGDLIWAWSLVWRVGDVLVPLGAIALWSTVLLTAYAVARELGQERSTALIVATAISVLPSQVSQIATAYVDNAVLAMVLAASLFLLILLRSGTEGAKQPSERVDGGFAASLLIGVSCGLGLLVKMSFLPLLAPAALILAWRSLRRRRPWDLAAFLGGLTVAAPNLIFNWVHRGSPFYPFEIFEFLPYNQQHSWILSKYGEGATVAELMRAAKALLINESPIDPFLNVGFLGLLLLILGIGGSSYLMRTSRGRWFLLWVAAGTVFTVGSFFSPKNSSMFALWTLVMGRLLVPSLAGVLVTSGLVGDRVVRGLLMPVLLVEYLFHARRKWPVEMTMAALEIIAVILAVVGLAYLTRKWRWRRFLSWTVATMALSLAVLATTGIREQWRWDAYRLYGERRLFDFHGVPPVKLWPIWREIDMAAPGRIAVTAGFDGLTGHNWFRWPFLGTWLQHDVVYLPVTIDGSLASYRDQGALREVADREVWLQRVADGEVDWVAALGPFTIEHEWILGLPEVFPIQITMGNDNFLLTRVTHSELDKYLLTTR